MKLECRPEAWSVEGYLPPCVAYVQDGGPAMLVGETLEQILQTTDPQDDELEEYL